MLVSSEKTCNRTWWRGGGEGWGGAGVASLFTCAGRHLDGAQESLPVLQVHHLAFDFIFNHVNKSQLGDDALPSSHPSVVYRSPSPVVAITLIIIQQMTECETSCRGVDRSTPLHWEWMWQFWLHLTLWRPLLPYGYGYKTSCARPGKPLFVIFDIRALWRSECMLLYNSIARYRAVVSEWT